MRCSKAQRWISRRVDGVLDERFEAQLADHFARCQACRAYAEALAGLDLSLLEAPEPTPDFALRVAQRLDRMPARRWPVLSRPAFFRPVTAGLGIAAALSGFVVGSVFRVADGIGIPSQNGVVELAAGEAIDPLGENSVESTLIAMLSTTEE